MKILKLFSILLLPLAILLASCGGPVNAPATPTAAATVLAELAATATSQPSPTPMPGKVLLIAPAGVDALPTQNVLAELSAPAAWTVETLPELQAAQITPNVKVVVALAAPANINDLLAAAPQTQFIVFSTADLQPAANLSVIRLRVENHAFLSGYISALLSQDYRAAGLLPSDGPLGALLQEAFVNGGRYYCGVCAPGWPLNFVYPVAVTNPAASDGPTWEAALASAFDNQKVDVVYLSSEAVRPEILVYLQDRVQFDRTMLVLGAQAPPETLLAQWAVSVRFDDLTALRQVWPDVSAGKGGALVEAPLALENINPDLLGAGRLRLVKELMEEIKMGRIYPFVIAP